MKALSIVAVTPRVYAVAKRLNKGTPYVFHALTDVLALGLDGQVPVVVPTHPATGELVPTFIGFMPSDACTFINSLVECEGHILTSDGQS